jgi:S1-C subfamily serine protease
VPAVLSGATGGVLARPGSGGLIGNAILRRFNIVFDLDRHRMYLRPNSRWRAPVRTDASGLQLLRRPGGATLVEHVVAGTPADLAGLMRGDELRTIDDTDAAAITLAELRDLLQEPGREFGLVVSRGGESRAVQLETRAFAGLGDVVDASVNAQTGSPPP